MPIRRLRALFSTRFVRALTALSQVCATKSMREIFEAGKGTLSVVSQYSVGVDNINRADANRYKIPFTNTSDVLTEAIAE